MMKIFLDLDGTILDVKFRCYSVYSDLLLWKGYRCLDIEEYWTWKREGISESEIVSKTTPPTFVESYLEERTVLMWAMEYLILDTVFDGVYDILNRWSDVHDLYLVTLRRDRDILDSQLHFFNLYSYFKAIYNDSLGEKEKVNLIKHEIFNPSNCVIVGDSETDIKAGKVLGIQTIALTSGVRSENVLAKLHPDVLVKNISQVERHLWI
jgi:phosphoglycolate phosphatase